MTRRELLATIPFAASAAAEAGSRGAMMWDYFRGELDRADSRRRADLTQVRTREQLALLGRRARRALLDGIGGLPQRTPLNAKVVGTLARSGYVIEKVIFESRPQYFVTATLYRPTSIAAPRPAVIQSCGHYAQGKAAPDYQRACIGLAKKGFIALMFDPMGQGERLMYRDATGKPLAGGATAEHVVAGKPTLLLGRTLAHYRIWDAIRALDYLETRPEVDRTRLGMLGHSGGGMMTLLTAPLEPRLRAVMSCCAVTSFYHKTKAQLMADPEQIVPGIYPAGIDHPELIAAVAPRAFLIGAALKDFVPLDGTRRTYDEVKPLFELAGAPDRFAKVETNDEHLLNRDLREACYGWMQKHLAGEAGDATEPAIEVETGETLRCTPTGCVMDLPGARRVFDLNLECAQQLQTRRAATPDLRSILHLPAKPAREPEIDLPSKVTGEGSVLLMVISPRRDPKLAAELAGPGRAVMELDLRGWGETTPSAPPKKGSFSWDEFFAFRAIEMGRPLLGMRIHDLLAVAEEHRNVYVIGLNEGGLVALHAAALSDRIAGVVASGCLPSYRQMLEQKFPAEPVSSVVPGVLTRYDLPDLLARIRPRPCTASAVPLNARRILEALHL